MNKQKYEQPHRSSTSALAVGGRHFFLAPAALAALFCLPSAARAGEPVWHDFKTPAPGAAAAIGGYSGGCLRGADRLGDDGPDHQLARPDRGRDFGHPLLVSFLRDFGKKVTAAGQQRLLIADMAQPRGGPAPGGHASHQSGLDVDVWYWAPAGTKRLPRAERIALTAPVVVDAAGKTTKAWSPRVAALVRLAAEDPRVDRVFVNPGVKRALCNALKVKPDWLRKVRPWYAHDAHFHVRLACPPDSPDCEAQEALPAGSGCEGLGWWWDAKAQAERDKNRARYRSKITAPPPLPAGCTAVAAAPAQAAPTPEQK